MRNTNKKGFTIVELVIVVAVIAILAAVLIPTFSSLIKKANQSSDIQATRQMNTALAIAGELADIDAVIDALAEAGFNSKDALVPVSAGYTFYWYETAKQIVLENDKGEVIFPEGVAKEEGVSLENSAKYIDVVAKTADDVINAISAGSEYIRLDANIEINEALTINAGEDIVVDLNGNSLTVTGYSDKANNKHHYAFEVKGNLTIKNGTINSRGIGTSAGANLVIEDGVTINALDTDAGACVFNREGATATINGGVFNASGNAAPVYNDGGELIINGGTYNHTAFEGSTSYAVIVKGGTATVANATINSTRGVFGVTAGTLTVTSGTFKAEGLTSGWCVYNAATTYINGGDFTHTGGSDRVFCDVTSVDGSVTVNGAPYTAE